MNKEVQIEKAIMDFDEKVEWIYACEYNTQGKTSFLVEGRINIDGIDMELAHQASFSGHHRLNDAKTTIRSKMIFGPYIKLEGCIFEKPIQSQLKNEFRLDGSTTSDEELLERCRLYNSPSVKNKKLGMPSLWFMMTCLSMLIVVPIIETLIK